MLADQPVVFGNSWEALVRVLGDKLDDALRARFLALGVDVRRPNPAYPYDTWVKSLELAMSVLYPGASEDEGSYLIGRAMLESYGHTLVGRALLAMLRALGPRRSLERMERNLRTTNNYSQLKVIMTSYNHYEITVNRVRFKHYYRGLFETGLQSGGAKDVKVLIQNQPDPEAFTFDISWS